MKVKYIHESLTVYKYCKQNCLKYNDVIRSILYYINKGNISNLNDVINKVLDKYMILKERKLISKTFLDVLNDNINVLYVCKVLNINRNAIYKVHDFGFSIRDSIIIIYFLSDLSKKEKSISIKRINQIKQEIEFQSYTNDISYLVCYYYLGYNTSDKIFSLINKMLKNLIYKSANNFGIKRIYNYIDDIMSDLFIKILQMLINKKILLSFSFQIKRYIYITTKFFIYEEMNKIRITEQERHLEDEIGEGIILMDVIDSNCY